MPVTDSGNKYALVLVDYATRRPEAFPLPKTDSKTVADQLMILFTRTGVPSEILTDCGENFTSKLLNELYPLLGVKSLTTTPYHPACDVMVERFNSTLKTMISSGVGSGTWPCPFCWENIDEYLMKQQDLPPQSYSMAARSWNHCKHYGASGLASKAHLLML